MGQQCCYNAEGIFTRSKRQSESNASVAAPAGSADLYFPVNSYMKHQYADYFPYRACCIESNHAPFCDQYYMKRPIDNNTDDTSETRCTSTVDNRGKYIYTVFEYCCVILYLDALAPIKFYISDVQYSSRPSLQLV